MDKEKGVALVFVFLIALAVATFLYFLYSAETRNLVKEIISTPTPSLFPYKNPIIPKNDSYRIVIVGDSIVGTLGPNANELRKYLIGAYPDSEFVTYNYGYPSTNVLSLYQRLTETTNSGTAENVAILKVEFELIIIESFGYNPPSEYPLAEGLQKQNQELERSVRAILLQKPKAALAFLTPIAPDPVNFGKGFLDLSDEERKKWVEERISYINNHRAFAEEKGIPVIDVYRASLGQNGKVNRNYISDDSIHPSAAGIALISKTIGDYIFANKIFPQ